MDSGRVRRANGGASRRPVWSASAIGTNVPVRVGFRASAGRAARATGGPYMPKIPIFYLVLGKKKSI